MSCPHFFYGNCQIIKQENEGKKELLEDLKTAYARPMSYFFIGKVIEKWDDRTKNI